MTHILPLPRCLEYLALAAMAALAGCTGSRQTGQLDDLSKRVPSVVLSSEMIHSPGGDMTARLPKDWVTLDVDKLESPQLFTVACNPDYTISLIFSEVPVDNAARQGYDRDGLRGLADASFQRRQKRSGGRAQLSAEIEEFAIGRRMFSAYTYSTDSMRTVTRVAVFFTNAHLYECAITHLTFNERELPSARRIMEIHQLVLSTVEW